MKRPSPIVERMALTLVFMVGIGLLVVGAMAASSGTPDGSASGDIVENREPLGAQGFSALPVLIDLETGWGVAEMSLNGEQIPEMEWDVVAELAQYRFTPGPGRSVEEYLPGANTVDMVVFELRDPSNTRLVSWEFQIF